MVFRQRLALMAAALWWGSLTAVGLWVVPLLFVHLPTPALAGGAAARLFSAQTWVALACGGVLLMAARSRSDPAHRSSGAGPLAWVLAGMLLAMLLEFGAAPRILARDNLPLWHAVGTGMFVLQWVCALVALWKLADTARAVSPENPS